MKRTLHLLACAALVTPCLAADARGLKPRPSPADYPAGTSLRDGTVLGAAILAAGEVRNAFATDLNRGWLVVELAIYPPKAGRAAIAGSDFVLFVRSRGETFMIRPQEASTVARILQRETKARSDSDVTLYPTVDVGYDSGPSIYGGRGGGWRTGAGVGVGIGKGSGPPPPASTAKDLETMQTELEEKGLPAGSAAAPAAGHLYFPVMDRKLSMKTASFELEYDGPAGKERFRLEKPANR